MHQVATAEVLSRLKKGTNAISVKVKRNTEVWTSKMKMIEKGKDEEQEETMVELLLLRDSFDLDLGSEVPPSYRSPFDDDDDQQDAGYRDGGVKM